MKQLKCIVVNGKNLEIDDENYLGLMSLLCVSDRFYALTTKDKIPVQP